MVVPPFPALVMLIMLPQRPLFGLKHIWGPRQAYTVLLLVFFGFSWWVPAFGQQGPIPNLEPLETWVRTQSRGISANDLSNKFSGQNITFGSSEFVFNAARTKAIRIIPLSTTQFVVAYQDEDNSDYGTAIVGELSGSGANASITYSSSEFVFNSAVTNEISLAPLSGTQFVIGYQDRGTDFYGKIIRCNS